MVEYTTKEAVAKTAETDPELAEYLNSDEGKKNPVVTMPFAEMARMGGRMRPPVPPDSEQERVLEIPARDGYTIAARLHKPASPPARSPLVVLIHGGGFVVGEPIHISDYARSVAALYGATVVNTTYRLAPTHKFPTAPNDVWDALQWLVRNAAALGADPGAGFVVGGVSAGGNLSAAAAQRWLSEQQQPPLTGIWLSIPYVFEPELVPPPHRALWFSREQNADAMIINKAAMAFVEDAYAPDHASRDFSPFNDPAPHRGLPPVYFQVCGQDPLRDDGLVYERVLRAHGVATRLDLYPGVPHGHANIFPTLASAKKSKFDTVRGLGWLLGRDASDDDIWKVLAASAPPAAEAPKAAGS